MSHLQYIKDQIVNLTKALLISFSVNVFIVDYICYFMLNMFV